MENNTSIHSGECHMNILTSSHLRNFPPSERKSGTDTTGNFSTIVPAPAMIEGSYLETRKKDEIHASNSILLHLRRKTSSWYVKVDGLGETLLLPTKLDENWPRTSRPNMQISHVLKTQYPDKIGHMCTSVAVWHSVLLSHISYCNTTWSD